MIDYILMDLDGTLTDPKTGITRSIQYALKSRDIMIEDTNSLCRHIGPPLRDSFMEYGFDEQEAELLIEKYREYYKEKGIFENEVIDGIEQLLTKLKASGKKLITATSKPEVFAKMILEHFQLERYFDDICGATMDGSRCEKADVIRYALDKNEITEYAKVVMVGDRKHDVLGAKTVGVASIGVLFGYGSREELQEAEADRIARTVSEIYDIILAM